MAGVDPTTSAGWRDERGETTLAQLDRHWAELLQELRVVQTGVQLGSVMTLSNAANGRRSRKTRVRSSGTSMPGAWPFGSAYGPAQSPTRRLRRYIGPAPRMSSP